MAHKLRFNPAIPNDLVTALDFYEEISPTLANRFRENTNRRLDDIKERPELFPMDIPPIRFAKIDRFPYIVFFVKKSDFVLILAIVHGSSDPGRWRNRE